MTSRHALRRFACAVLLLAAVGPAYAQHDAAADRRQRRRSPVVRVFDQCKDAIVNISSTHIVKVRRPYGFDPMFEQFFRSPPGESFRQYQSVGSGFVIHPAGYVVTNAHVVARTAERKVIFEDKREYAAQIVALDEQRDLAVLKIEPDRPLTALRLGTSDDLMVGETTIAIGNPLGLQNTVTVGVVSALDRSLQVSKDSRFEGLIQTDASINPGNSGGPLLNVLGELIGVNTAIRGDAQNIGFAVPVDQLRRVLPDLLDVERRYGFITGMRLSVDNRCRVLRVDGESPADRAGVEVGDRLVRMNGRSITCAIEYHIALIGLKGGNQVALRLQRDGKTLDVTLTLDERPRPDGAKLLRERFGIGAVALTADMARQRRLDPRVKGLLVTAVDPGSPAAAARFQRGDIIPSLGRYAVTNLEDAGELLDAVEAGQRIAMVVLRIERNTIFQQRIVLAAR